MPRNPACTRCVLHHSAEHNRCVWGEGDGSIPIMLIAEAPGEEEDKTGKPFMGAAGNVLNRALIEAGIPRERIYIANIAKCRPPSNRTPTDAEAAACFPYLAEEINQMRPRLIVALGATALKKLTGQSAIGKSRGVVLPPRPGIRLPSRPGEDPPQIMGTYHPAALLHRNDPMIYEALVKDLKTAAQLAGVGPTGKVLPEHHMRLLYPDRAEHELDEALDWLASGATDKLVSIDCEWTGDRTPPGKQTEMFWPWVRGAQLYSVALSMRSVDGVRSVGISTPLSAADIGSLSLFLAGKLAIFHNAMADLLWLLPTGLTDIIRLAGDSMVLSYLLDENESHRLETLCVSRLGVKPWKSDLWPVRPTTRAEWKRLLSYNCTDVYMTLLLEAELRIELKARGTIERSAITKFYTRMMLPAIPTFVRMAHAGAPLDKFLLNDALAKVEMDIQTAISELADLIGCSRRQAEGIAMSPTQTVGYFRREGILVASSRADSLAEINHPAVPLIKRIRSKRKLKGTYLQPWAEMVAEQTDSEPRLHTMYRITVARTGRTSAEVRKGASIQLVKRGDEIKPIIRAREGRVLISADYCLDGDEKVRTVHGLQAIKDIQPGEFAFGVLNGQPVVRRVTAQRLVGRMLVYRLQTSHGEILATYEHRFAMLDGSYRQLGELEIGDRLQAVTRYMTSSGRPRLCVSPSDGSSPPTGYGKDEHRVVAEGIYGVPDGYDVHHRDEDKSNNDPENLMVLPSAIHKSEHKRDWWQQFTSEERKAMRAPYTERMRVAWEKKGGKFGASNPNYGKDTKVDATCPNCQKPFRTYPEGKSGHRTYCVGTCYHEARRTRLNHTVYSVMPVEYRDVYCIEVDECENFVLENGVVSHNSNIEMRVAAHVAGERRMIQLFNENADLHKATAAFIKETGASQISLEKFWPNREQYMALVTGEERQGAKGVNFGLLYGMQTEHLIDYARSTYGVTFTFEEADTARNGYFQLYPDLLTWHQNAEADVARGYVITPMGYIRRGIADFRKAVNTPVQSTASYITMEAQIEIDAAIRAGKMPPADLAAFVHDSITLETNVEHGVEVMAMMIEIMEHPKLEEKFGLILSVPLAVEAKMSRSWK